MALTQRLVARQSQQLTMTPQLQQSIKLLTMAGAELRDFVNAEIESNPLLETGQSEETTVPTGPEEGPESLNIQFRRTDMFTAGSAFDSGAENLTGVFADSLSPLRGQAGAPRPPGASVDDTVAGQNTLRDSLSHQIGLMSLPGMVRAIALVLVDELDDDGYLRADVTELALRLGVRPDDLEAARKAIMSCDPAGVGARSLGECLALQLGERGCLDDDARVVLDHLDLLAKTGPEAFARRHGLSADRLSKTLDRLRVLNPAPGLIFETGITEYATPDVMVARNNLGGWSVELNTAALPRVLMTNRYASMVDRRNAKTVEFIAGCSARARWLINALDQRARTILRIASEIVRLQDGFFSQGVSALRPMTLRDVADNLNVHESTVSRVTVGKYLICERGTFELKYFFTSGIGAGGGTDVLSSRSVQEKIRRLIDEEDGRKTLSDEGIVKALAADGIVIARRTVTKYREAMRIPSSIQRRRHKSSRTQRSS